MVTHRLGKVVGGQHIVSLLVQSSESLKTHTHVEPETSERTTGLSSLIILLPHPPDILLVFLLLVRVAD